MDLENIDLNSLIFTKPKRHSEYLVCKVKYSKEDAEVPMEIQFPKMKIVNQPSLKNIELEFQGTSGYNKNVYNFLSNIDNYIAEYITKMSEEWFGKKIPEESINKMYNKFIKSPKTSENNCTINFSFKQKKNELITELINRKNDPIKFEDLEMSQTLECIAEMKYIIFSKDTCFVQWEICTAKLHRKMSKVPAYGFVDDPNDRENVPDNSDDELEIHSFY
jgi:hypothetical protein